MGDEELARAQALGHVGRVAVVNEKAASDRDGERQLQQALTSRIVLERAKRVLASVG